jgi:hypothetical protein
VLTIYPESQGYIFGHIYLPSNAWTPQLVSLLVVSLSEKMPGVQVEIDKQCLWI